jgi:hypothetical protein
MLNMDVSFFTRLGFLQEIEQGSIAWRPLVSAQVKRLRLGLVVPANRSLSPPADQLARRLSDDLHRYGAI